MRPFCPREGPALPPVLTGAVASEGSKDADQLDDVNEVGARSQAPKSDRQ